MAKKYEKYLQKALKNAFDTQSDFQKDAKKAFRRRDRSLSRLVSKSDFKKVLSELQIGPEELRPRDVRSGKLLLKEICKAYSDSSDDEINYSRFIQDCVTLIDPSASGSKSRKLDPTAEEELQNQLEQRFATWETAESEMKRAFRKIGTRKKGYMSLSEFSKLLKRLELKVESR